MHSLLQNGGFLTSPLFSTHSRSSSLSALRAPTPRRSHSKSKSTTAIRTMAPTDSGPATPDSRSEQLPESFHDAQDAPSAHIVESPSESQNPHFSHEITALNAKLVRAINQQTNLDEKLAQAKHELEASKVRIARLEAEANAHEEKISSGQLISKDVAEKLNNKLVAQLADERKQKGQAQSEKRGIESELENLTASLFDEANKMVASANMQREATEKKNQQLRDQIKDGEMLIASQGEQLAELKRLLQNTSSDRQEVGQSPNMSSAPSSPAMTREDHNIIRLMEAMNLTPTTPQTSEISPAPATTFTHLLKPLCRSDIPAYEDFRSLVALSTRSNHPSRAGSGNYGGLNVMGISSLSGLGNLTSTPMNGSSSSINSLSNNNSKNSSAHVNTSTAAIPGSFITSPTPSYNSDLTPRGPIPLKDTKFYKRVLTEDVEPTLRLDLSPTISWLNRRSILSAFADSGLIVEPIPEANRRLYGKYTPCSMCGEARREEQNPRTHWMRVNDGEGATKWPICTLCLEKVRGVGDLVGYVRMIRDGVVKCGDKSEEQEAWDDLVRLRERLFWARMAGGVVPSFLPSSKVSPAIGDGNIAPKATSGGMPSSDANDVHSAAMTGENVTERKDKEKDTASVHSHSDDGSQGQREAAMQLQNGLNESLTTFDSIRPGAGAALKSRSAGATPPGTPPRYVGSSKRESIANNVREAFPRISIPRIPDTFWGGQVNVLK